MSRSLLSNHSIVDEKWPGGHEAPGKVSATPRGGCAQGPSEAHCGFGGSVVQIFPAVQAGAMPVAPPELCRVTPARWYTMALEDCRKASRRSKFGRKI